METSSAVVPVEEEEQNGKDENNGQLLISKSSSVTRAISENVNMPESNISESPRLSTEREWLNAQLALAHQRIVEQDAQISEQNTKLKEASTLLILQQMKLDDEFSCGKEGDKGNGDADGEAAEIKELMDLLTEERKQRLVAEEKVVKLKDSLKSLNEELTQLVKEIKEGEEEGQQIILSSKEQLNKLSECVLNRLVKKEEEQMKLKGEVNGMNEYLAKLLKMVSTQNLEPSMAPLAENIKKLKTHGEPKVRPMLHVKVEKAKKAMVPPEKREQENGETVEHAKMPGDSSDDNVPIPIITIDDEDASSIPQPVPIDPESNLNKEFPAHGSAMDNPLFGRFYCICDKSYQSLKGLQAHIYRNNIKYRCNCYSCRCRRFVVTRLKKEPEKGGGVIKRRGKGKGVLQVAQSIISKQRINKRKFHCQVSSSLLEKYACACGNMYTRHPGLLKHIADF